MVLTRVRLVPLAVTGLWHHLQLRTLGLDVLQANLQVDHAFDLLLTATCLAHYLDKTHDIKNQSFTWTKHLTSKTSLFSLLILFIRSSLFLKSFFFLWESKQSQSTGIKSLPGDEVVT